MSTATLPARHGVYFNVSTWTELPLPEVARQVGGALQATLTPSPRRGLEAELEAEVFGLRVQLAWWDRDDTAPVSRVTCYGGLDCEVDEHIQHQDISDFVADLLTRTTALRWTPDREL